MYSVASTASPATITRMPGPGSTIIASPIASSAAPRMVTADFFSACIVRACPPIRHPCAGRLGGRSFSAGPAVPVRSRCCSGTPKVVSVMSSGANTSLRRNSPSDAGVLQRTGPQDRRHRRPLDRRRRGAHRWPAGFAADAGPGHAAAAGRPSGRARWRPHTYDQPTAPAAARADPRRRAAVPVRSPGQSAAGHGAPAGCRQPDPPAAGRRTARDIVRLDRKLKDSDKRLREAVAETGTGLLDL